MSDRLEQDPEQELNELLRRYDPDEPVNLDGEFVLSEANKEAGTQIDQLCVPPSSKAGDSRAVVAVNNQAWAIQFHTAFLSLSAAILPMMGGGILSCLAGLIQAIVIIGSTTQKLNKAEVFIIALLADTAEKKLDQKTLKSAFFAKGYTAKGDPEFIFDRAMDRLVELRILTMRNPYVCLTHTVISLPEVKPVHRLSKRAKNRAE